MLGGHVLAVQLPGHDRVGVQRLVARQGLGEPVVAVLGHRGALVGPGHHDALVRRVAEAGGRQDVGEARARPARLPEHAEPELVARGAGAAQPAAVAGALEHRDHVPGGQLAQLGLAQHGGGTVRPDEPHLAEPTRVGLRVVVHDEQVVDRRAVGRVRGQPALGHLQPAGRLPEPGEQGGVHAVLLMRVGWA